MTSQAITLHWLHRRASIHDQEKRFEKLQRGGILDVPQQWNRSLMLAYPHKKHTLYYSQSLFGEEHNWRSCL